MEFKKYTYMVKIQETSLDSFGHVNNAQYLILYEQARWAFFHENEYGIEKIKASGFGPVILDLKLSFLKELHARDEIDIESQTISMERKVGKLQQRMLRGAEICSTAEFTFGLFDIKARKLAPPTSEWLRVIGAI